MRVKAEVLKDGEELGYVEIDMERLRVRDLVKIVSRDFGGEEFRRIMLYEDFTRSVFLSGPEVVLRIPDDAFVEDAIDWFGRFYLTFLFNRAKLVFVFGEESKERVGDLGEIFMGSGNYNGAFVTPAPLDQISEFAMRRKRLSEIIELSGPKSVKLDRGSVEPSMSVLEVVRLDLLHSIKGLKGKRPVSILELPKYSAHENLEKIELWELCLLGERVVLELEEGEKVLSCSR